jgi:hypothetical protein
MEYRLRRWIMLGFMIAVVLAPIVVGIVMSNPLSGQPADRMSDFGAALAPGALVGVVLFWLDLAAEQRSQREGLRMTLSAERSLDGWALDGADLSGFRLPGRNLKKADLTRARLQRAHLRRAQLHDAILQSAKLQRADLRGADLTGAKLKGAKLKGAKFDRDTRADGRTVWPDGGRCPILGDSTKSQEEKDEALRERLEELGAAWDPPPSEEAGTGGS